MSYHHFIQVPGDDNVSHQTSQFTALRKEIHWNLKLVRKIVLGSGINSSLLTRFAVSRSGSIATAADRHISVYYPHSDRLQTTFPTTTGYFEPVFIQKPREDKEYFAAHSLLEESIHLWDVENQTATVALRLGKLGQFNLCLKLWPLSIFGPQRAFTASLS